VRLLVIGGIAAKRRKIRASEGLGRLVVVRIGLWRNIAAGCAVFRGGRGGDAGVWAKRCRGTVGVGFAFWIGGIQHCGLR